MDEEIEKIVSQLKLSIYSIEVHTVIGHLHSLKESQVESDMGADLLSYTLLVHQFYCYLALLFEVPSIIQGVIYAEGKSSTHVMLRFLRSE